MTVNQAVVDTIDKYKEVMPSPIRHGYFNRRMVFESLFVGAGFGCGMEADTIKKYAGITDKEFDLIIQEYIDAGVIKVVDNMFGVRMYYLNM